MPEPIFEFAESLRRLLLADSPEDVEVVWRNADLDLLGWRAILDARERDDPQNEAVLGEVDGLLNRVLERVPEVAAEKSPAANHVRTFRLAELQRLQSAAAAALVGQRFGVAGLRTVVEDRRQPLARRYYAYLRLAEWHPRGEWDIFSRYLSPARHHAFLGAAVEAARFYPERRPADLLIALFESVRRDQHLRTFLSPRLLQSLFVLGDHRCLGFVSGLLVTGFTDRDPRRCEILRSLATVYRLTGRIEPNSRYGPRSGERMRLELMAALEIYDNEREVLSPVSVL